MPIVVEGLNNPSNNEFTTFTATGGVEDMKVVFAVLPAFKFIEDGILSKRLEALGTDKAALVPDLTP